MARRRPLEETLLALRRVREAPDTEDSRRELRRVVQTESSHAVARAAALVGELGLDGLVPDLVACFDRFFVNPVRSDPGCSAKTAIVEALRLEKDDAAAEAAAVALGESRHREALAALREWLPRASRRGLARVALLAVASLRSDEAIELLLSVVREEPAATAREALACLASLGRTDALSQRVAAAVGSRSELREALARGFGQAPRRSEGGRA